MRLICILIAFTISSITYSQITSMSLCPPTLEGNGNFESCATELSSACYTSVTCANWLVTGVIDYNEYQYDGGESYGPKVFNPQTCAGNQEIIDPSPLLINKLTPVVTMLLSSNLEAAELVK